MPIYYDNQAIIFVKNLESCKRFKHIDTQYCFIYEKYRIRKINIKYILKLINNQAYESKLLKQKFQN